MLELDHLLWATPDLDAGVDLIRSLTGVASARGGSHPAWGTRNSLLALGAGVYLEIIGPDEEQDLNGKVGARMAALPRAGLTRFAVRTNDLLRLRETAKAAGLGTEGPFGMHRDRPDGVRLAWSMLMLSHAAYGEAIPFAINWGATPHPSATAPSGCRLRAFRVLHPEPEPLTALYAALAIPAEVKRAARPGLLAALDTPKGELLLTEP